MKILLILGDYWHAPGPLEHGIKGALKPLDADFDTCIDPADVPFSSLGRYDLVILSKEGNSAAGKPEKWLDLAGEKAIADYVESGGRLLGLHGGLCTYHEGGPLRSLMKGHFVHHPPDCDVTVYPVDGDHPVCTGVEEFTVYDEQYRLDVDPASTRVFLESRSPQGETTISGWTHPAGKGFFLGLTPGHTRGVLGHPMMERILLQSARYLAG